MTTICHRSTSHHAGLTGLLQILTALAGALDAHPHRFSYPGAEPSSPPPRRE